MLRSAIAVALLVTLLTACGRTPPVAPIDLGGTWTGTWSSSQVAAGGTVEVAFVQSGGDLSGTLTITGTPCLTEGTISGTVSATGTTFGAVQGGDEITFASSTIDADAIEGTYTVGSGLCAGDSGTFVLERDE